MLFADLRREWTAGVRGGMPALSPAAEELFHELGRLGQGLERGELSPPQASLWAVLLRY
ncbi:hypothetical protein EV192_106737 [Actinocrispum wychmicini]|uniref:Uncharacterized protein n=2 Tax=Actinocrispum wychmicini TaxID=1213861 RepID=A0A4V2S6S9_9PSEU|nr:hypothetical protein EV192_106737 [Actinocrispum wychmicini]